MRPENPETIIVKNEFYPSGLTENDVWNYYQKNKSFIIKESFPRDVMLAIMVKQNEYILKRKTSDGKFLQLTNSTYDTLMHGRTITVYNIMKFYESFGIIDIDFDQFDVCKQAAADVYDSILEAPFTNKAHIKFTGKEGFHIICEFKRKGKIDAIRFLLKNHLSRDMRLKKYTIEQKRTSKTPNLDLSPNKLNGAYIATHSLSVIGLKCEIINYNDLSSFNPRQSKI